MCTQDDTRSCVETRRAPLRLRLTLPATLNTTHYKIPALDIQLWKRLLGLVIRACDRVNGVFSGGATCAARTVSMRAGRHVRAPRAHAPRAVWPPSPPLMCWLARRPSLHVGLFVGRRRLARASLPLGLEAPWPFARASTVDASDTSVRFLACYLRPRGPPPRPRRPAEQQMIIKEKSKTLGGPAGIEPATTRTLSEYHTTRPRPLLRPSV